MDILTAKQARDLTEKHSNIDIKKSLLPVFRLIEEQSNKGKFFCYYYHGCELSNSHISFLEGLGFDVDLNNIDRDGGYCYYISWEK